MIPLLTANRHGIFVNRKSLLKTDFKITPETALEWAEEIINCNAQPKDKVNALLKIDSCQFCEMGRETPKKERDFAKRVSHKIYKAIAKLDKHDGELLLTTKD